jgi:hypothetical protein
MKLLAAFLDGTLLEYSTALGAVAGGGFALYQYWKSLRWQRAKLGNEVLERLQSDEWIATACLMLDWSEREISVPKGLVGFVRKEQFIHRVDLMSSALKPRADGATYTREEVIYRDAFDRFFQFLESVNAAIDSGLYEPKDVRPLGYYLKAIYEPRFLSAEAVADLRRYLNDFGYSVAISELYRRILGITPPAPTASRSSSSL